MATLRLKPTSYRVQSQPYGSFVQNPETILNGANPEDACNGSYLALRAASNGGAGGSSNDCPFINIFFTFPSDLVNKNIKKISMKTRMISYGNSNTSTSYMPNVMLRLNTSSTTDYEYQGGHRNSVTDAQTYMNENVSHYDWYDITDSSFINNFKANLSTINIRVNSGYYNQVSYFSGFVLDIEYEEPNDLKIGTNKLKKAILDNTLIKRIYKGTNLLFKYGRLPDNFKELEYIQSQWYPLTYIDTGVAWNASTKIEAEFITRSTGSNGTKLFVATQGDSSMPGFTYLYIDTSNQVIGSNVSVSTYVVGTDSVEATYTSSTTSNIYLTAWSDTYWACTFRYKNIKIYNGNTLLRNYIPCYRVSDGAAGLYDLVNNVFYDSDGSSNYLKGPETEIELPAAYQKVEYIEGSGDIYIDTNYVCQNDSTFYFDYKDEQVHSEVVYANYFYTPYYRLIRFPNHTNTVLETRNTTTTMDFVDVPSTPYNTRNKVEFLIDKVLDASSNVLATYPHTSAKLGVDSHLILFRGYYYNSWDSYGYYKLYGFKVFEGNGSTLVKNYVPCYRKSDNVIGLYETVQGQFITGTGTGSFTKGPNII